MLAGKDIAKTSRIAIPWTHVPVASKLEVAFHGNPPPTSSLCTLTLFALLDVVRLGPFRVASQRSIKCGNPFLYFTHVFPMPHNFVNNLQKVNKKEKFYLTF